MYDKSWGKYDLICAENIISCFPKAADKKSFAPKTYMYKSETIKVNYSQKEKDIHSLYKEVRDYRENQPDFNRLRVIFDSLIQKSSSEWLIILEIAQLAQKSNNKLFIDAKNYLIDLSNNNPNNKKLILDGLRVL